MTRMLVSREVCEAFGGLRIDAVVASGFAGHRPWPELDARLAALEDGAAASPGSPGTAGDPRDDPHIAAWHAAYRAFGTNPRRQRPSAEALRRRLARSGRLPRVNPAVDCYNLVSASYGVPAGAFDLSAVTGDIVIRVADGSETFTPLGEPGTTESPHPGEVIYTDAAGVLTRHWNHRDADRTKVTRDSRLILFLLETVDAATFGPVLDAATASLAGLLASRSDSVAVHQVTAADAATPGLVPGGGPAKS
jgi:DNA/RNA-binding domain of Phe-tRNA-synthetase-like protein